MHHIVSNRTEKIVLLYGLLILAIIGYSLYSNRQVLFYPTNIDQVSQAYSQSQYVLGEGSPQKIDDGTVYLYAGYAYLQGQNPTTVNFEQPPLGKYIFGISYRLFHTSFLLNIFVYTGILVSFIVLARQIGLQHLFTVVSLLSLVLLTSLNHHVGMALLDSMILLCSLLFFVVLFSKIRTVTYGSLLGAVIGCLMSIKYPFPLIAIYFAMLFVWLWWQKTWRPLLLIIPTAFAIYLISYTFFFLDHKTFIDFLKFEWYRYKWWTGDRTIPKFLIFQTLFFGKFKAWWDTNSVSYISDGDWNMSWPVLFILSLVATWRAVKIKSQKLVLLSAYSLLLLAIYALGSASFGRYLLQLVPIWILLIAMLAQTSIKKIILTHGKI